MNLISISYSSDKKLARCEQQAFYRYEEKLKPRVKKEGLFRGDIIHQLLKAYYSGIDWQKAFDKIKKEQWDTIFEEEREEYGENFMEEIWSLLDHYVDYWGPSEEDWRILHTEKKFELMTKLGLPLRWICDLIIKDGEVNCLIETKAKKTIPEAEERILQPQVHAYAFLCSRVGIRIDKIIWNYIRTKPVPRPKILKNGNLSERKINTDQRGYLKSLKEAGLMPTSEEDIIGLNNKLEELPETLSLERVTNSVNLRLGKQWVRDWIERHRRALEIKRPLRSWGYRCKFECDYYKLCQADMRGDVDRGLIIKKDFIQKIEEELK